MSESTDAILFYGYCWSDELLHPWSTDDDDDDEEWEDRYSLAKGLAPPLKEYPTRTTKDYSTPTDYSDEEKSIIEQHRSYWKARAELVESSGCTIDWHCDDYCKIPYVAVRESEIINSRGDASEINSLYVHQGWNNQLEDFCKVMGFNTDGMKLTWWMASKRS